MTLIPTSINYLLSLWRQLPIKILEVHLKMEVKVLKNQGNKWLGMLGISKVQILSTIRNPRNT
jgi:hypothetical protein